MVCYLMASPLADGLFHRAIMESCTCRDYLSPELKRSVHYLGGSGTSAATKTLSLTIRPIEQADEPFLWEMLYHALFVSEGQRPFPKDIVRKSNLARYVDDWGKEHDRGFIAIDDSVSRSVGAVWVRLFAEETKGYGYIDSEIPELSIALLPEYRNQGIGGKLIETLIDDLESEYPAISLSVSDKNPAVRLYERFGFEIVDHRAGSFTMRKDLCLLNKSAT